MTIRLTPSRRARPISPGVHWSISITGKNSLPRTWIAGPLTVACAVAARDARKVAAAASEVTAAVAARAARNVLSVREEIGGLLASQPRRP